MRTARWINAGLWVVNVLLGVGVVVFAFDVMLADPGANPLEDLSFELPEDIRQERSGNRVDYRPLLTLPNPVVPEVGKSAHGEAPTVNAIKGVKLVGTFPASDETRGVAILEVEKKNLQITARYMLPITDGEKAVPELQGWKLSRVSSDFAVLTAGSRTATLWITRDPLPKDGEGPVSAGEEKMPRGTAEPFDAKKYRSRKIRDTPQLQTWEIDPAEAKYAGTHALAILERDVNLSVYADGGLRVDKVQDGGLAAARGIQAGDVVKNVNGVPIKNMDQIRTLLKSQENQRVLRLSMLRAGRMVTVEYRLGGR